MSKPKGVLFKEACKAVGPVFKEALAREKKFTPKEKKELKKKYKGVLKNKDLQEVISNFM